MPAMVVVPQSFADLLVPHAHAHAVCSLGLFFRDGRARGPPPCDSSTPPAGGETINPQCDVDDYFFDPSQSKTPEAPSRKALCQ